MGSGGLTFRSCAEGPGLHALKSVVGGGGTSSEALLTATLTPFYKWANAGMYFARKTPKPTGYLHKQRSSCFTWFLRAAQDAVMPLTRASGRIRPSAWLIAVHQGHY